MAHDTEASLLDMFQAVERAERLMANLDEQAFLADERTQWAVYSQIIILGEAGGRIERAFCDSHSEIPWTLITGMRHRLIHGYDSVNWERVWMTVRHDLPNLKAQLQKLLRR